MFAWRLKLRSASDLSSRLLSIFIAMRLNGVQLYRMYQTIREVALYGRLLEPMDFQMHLIYERNCTDPTPLHGTNIICLVVHLIINYDGPTPDHDITLFD